MSESETKQKRKELIKQIEENRQKKKQERKKKTKREIKNRDKTTYNVQALRQYHNQHYQRILGEAHTAISIGYNSAIFHYKQQKNNFMKTINQNQEIEISVKDLLEEINQAAINAAQQDQQEMFNDAFKSIKDNVEGWFKNFLISDGENNEDYRKLVESFKKSAKNYINKYGTKNISQKNIYDRMSKKIEKFLKTQNITKFNTVKKWSTELNEQGQVVPSRLATASENMTNIRDNLYGYIRRRLLVELQKHMLSLGEYADQNISSLGGLDDNIGAFQRAIKGYYMEDVLAKAFNEVLSKYGLQARTTGVITAGNKKNKKMIIEDIAILYADIDVDKDNKLEEIMKKLHNLRGVKTGQGSKAIKPFVTGIQSKSWKLPTKKITNLKQMPYIMAGTAFGKVPIGMEAYFWHAGVRNIMSNLLSLLGENNSFYSTGDGISFTSDLLLQMKRQGYVYALYKSVTENKIVSPTIVIAKHLD